MLPPPMVPRQRGETKKKPCSGVKQAANSEQINNVKEL
jgi:hypothetical protein